MSFEHAAAGEPAIAPKAVGWARWHRLFFGLAAFDILTVCVGLFLTHTIMDIYRTSVAVSGVWAGRALAYSRLGELAAAVNAPANDVFDSRDPEVEATRMAAAVRVFDGEFDELRMELQGLPPDVAAPLMVRLNAVRAAMDTMRAEAEVIFDHFRAQRLSLAAERMATMDKKYAVLNSALAELRHAVGRIQQRHFEQQMSAAARVEKGEYLVAALILVMVGGAMLYGVRTARRIEADRLEKERHLQALADAREQLRERSQALKEANERLQALSKRTLQMQEAQRQHVARELHEEVAQMLASITMRLEAIEAARSLGKKAEPHVENARAIAESALARLRGVVSDLTPHGMEQVGLAGVLPVHVGEWTRGSGVAVRFSEHLSEPRPPFIVETAAYRIAEEAVANAMRHANADELSVELRQTGGALQLRVEDNGVGFDLDAARRSAAHGDRLGIAVMEQRAAVVGGVLEITSQPGGGTRVSAFLPGPA